MVRFKNGEIPREELVVFATGSNEDGYWEHRLPPSTHRKHLRLVALGEERRGRTLQITPGWNGDRPIAFQRTARQAACDRGRCQDAAVPGSSSHGGTFTWGGRLIDTAAIDYLNWLWVWGSYEAFAAACHEAGLTPGVFDWEPWHVIDLEPWAAVPAAVTEEEFMPKLSDEEQTELLTSVREIRNRTNDSVLTNLTEIKRTGYEIIAWFTGTVAPTLTIIRLAVAAGTVQLSEADQKIIDELGTGHARIMAAIAELDKEPEAESVETAA